MFTVIKTSDDKFVYNFFLAKSFNIFPGVKASVNFSSVWEIADKPIYNWETKYVDAVERRSLFKGSFMLQ